jgi:hypothetical protein
LYKASERFIINCPSELGRPFLSVQVRHFRKQQAAPVVLPALLRQPRRVPVRHERPQQATVCSTSPRYLLKDDIAPTEGRAGQRRSEFRARGGLLLVGID